MVRRNDGLTGYALFSNVWKDADEHERQTREFMAGVDRRITEIHAQFEKQRQEHEAFVEHERQCAAGKLWIGMTREEACRAWCQPYTINTTETASGTREQWVYRYRGQYLYFDNGLLGVVKNPPYRAQPAQANPPARLSAQEFVFAISPRI